MSKNSQNPSNLDRWVSSWNMHTYKYTFWGPPSNHSVGNKNSPKKWQTGQSVLRISAVNLPLSANLAGYGQIKPFERIFFSPSYITNSSTPPVLALAVKLSLDGSPFCGVAGPPHFKEINPQLSWVNVSSQVSFNFTIVVKNRLSRSNYLCKIVDESTRCHGFCLLPGSWTFGCHFCPVCGSHSCKSGLLV